MNKHQIESFNAHQTRRMLRLRQREAAQAAIVPRVLQAPSLTKNQIDRFMQLRLDREATRRTLQAQVFGKKKKMLPMPVFACENTDSKQVRPRVLE